MPTPPYTPTDRLAGLMQLRLSEKSFKHADSLAELCAVCDLVFILDDRSDPPIPAKEWFAKYPKLQSIIRVDERDDPHWNEWTARTQLLLAAAKHHCNYVFWLDDDESFWPKADRSLVDPLIARMKQNPTLVSIHLPWLEIWNTPGQVRTDGWWGRISKPFLQKNPFFISSCICFPNNALHRIHCWPIQRGSTEVIKHPAILHYGMMTIDDRNCWRAKYLKQDPANEFAQQAAKEWQQTMDETIAQIKTIEEAVHGW